MSGQEVDTADLMPILQSKQFDQVLNIITKVLGQSAPLAATMHPNGSKTVQSGLQIIDAFRMIQ